MTAEETTTTTAAASNRRRRVMLLVGAGQIGMAIASYFYGPLRPQD